MKVSLWQQHVEAWKGCTKCDLHRCRMNVVLARGQIPCDILFVGEAPGKSEDALGKPFIGPAGKLLDEIITQALDGLGIIGSDGQPRRFRTAFTNVVACIPLFDDGSKNSEPDPKDIKACRPRLVEFVRIAQPKLIILVGKLAKSAISGQSMFSKYQNEKTSNFAKLEWIPDNKFLAFAEVDHPAYILRMNIAQQGLAIQRCVVRIRCAAQEL